MKRLILVLVIVFLAFPAVALASVGVGVGTGKIQVTEKLYPGTIYELPTLTVINTGDEAGDYSVGISYMEKQAELKPAGSWFKFSPEKFHLDPGKAQVVTIKLDLPLKTEPGNYFAFVEGFPVKAGGSGTTVGIAAAAKLYFTVKPANIFSGIYYRVLSIWKINQPWSSRVALAGGIIVVLVLAKKFLNIQIGLKKKQKEVDEN